MPVYDPRAREQFRQAALGRSTRSRRASCDSNAVSKSLPVSSSSGKLLLPPGGPSPTHSQPSSPIPPGKASKRRSSLAPTTWLNSHPHRMYEKLPQSPTRSSTESVLSQRTPDLKIEDHADLEHEFGSRINERRSLPDIGLPMGSPVEHALLLRSPLVGKPLVGSPPPIPEDVDAEEEETSLSLLELSEAECGRLRGSNSIR